MRKSIESFTLAVIIISAGLAAYALNLLDRIVHITLYNYGLLFNLAWANPYWNLLHAIQILLIVIACSGIAVIMFTVGEFVSIKNPSEEKTQKQNLGTDIRSSAFFSPAKNFSLTFVVVGAIILAFSVNFDSLFLTFIGLGLVFWGAILFYIRPRRYVQGIVLDRITLPLLENTEKMLNELGCQGRGVYLPPKNLYSIDSSLVFIPSKTQQSLPKVKEADEGILRSQNPAGIFLRPAGSGLLKLVEDELGESFVRTDLSMMQEKLARILVENLEMAEEIEIRREESKVSVEITNHVFQEICNETRKLPKTHNSIGCPLCSAIACMLAKATGRPIKIENEEQDEGGNTAKIQYTIMED